MPNLKSIRLTRFGNAHGPKKKDQTKVGNTYMYTVRYV